MDNDKKFIGICGVRIHEQNVLPFVQGLKEESERRGLRLISFSGSSASIEDTDEILGQYEFLDLIKQVDICALVILSETILNESVIYQLVEIGKEKEIPVFSLDRKVSGCYNLVMDNEGCFEQIVRHVVEEHGCRRINMIAGDEGNRFSEERIDVYRKVLKENNIPFEKERIGYGNYWECPVTGVMNRFFESNLPFPEAIICANDIMAHAAISILNEHGMEVPEDIIVTGYDGTKDGAVFFPSLTTGMPLFKEAVLRLFEEIDKCSRENHIEPCDITVSVKMKKCQSCGCQKKSIPEDDRRISKLLEEIGNGKWHMKCMHLMLSDTFGKQRIEDIYDIIPRHMDIWFDFYRYVCLKSEVLNYSEVPVKCNEVTSILEGNRGRFKEIGEKWSISCLQSYLERVLADEKVTTILIHPLISGKTVYGFSVEGFEELVDWQIKQCDEFAMFLSHILHTVFHNHKMNELNRDLHKINKEVEKMSLCDPMTGIYNRRGFFYQVKQIIQKKENQGKYLYLFMVDMDGLKYINDNFGHAEGDYAITTLAKALVQMGNDNSVCARLGGDEFMCAYVCDDENGDTTQTFSEKLDELIAKTEMIMDKEYPVSASVGRAAEKIVTGLDLDALINAADSKMYGHKMARKEKRDR